MTRQHAGLNRETVLEQAFIFYASALQRGLMKLA